MSLTRQDILSRDEFASARERMGREVEAVKNLRRVQLGAHMTLLFDNKITLRWQVHEMCRVEGITRPEAVAHEVETYGALMPGPSELSFTLLIAYADPAERAVELRRLHSLPAHLSFEVEGCPPAPAVFDTDQYDDIRLSSVQFVRVPLTGAQREGLFDLRRTAAVVSDHPAYTARTLLSPTTRAALMEDLDAAAAGSAPQRPNHPA